MRAPTRWRRQPRQRNSLIDVLGQSMHRLRGSAADYDPLHAAIGSARVVLIGEASHGTTEFYAQRAEITKRLIVERGFGAVCIEGDWPDAYRVDCFVRGRSNDRTPEDALQGFQRFPTWMWRNEVLRDFVQWLRAHNDRTPEHARVGFYGLDLYSMYGSIRAVLAYLDRTDPDAAKRARHRYSCFDHFGEDSQSYGYATAADLAEPCEQDAVRELVELRAFAADYSSRDGLPAADDFFSAEQNARLILNAESYYRAMYRGRASSWNLRDRHMMDTLNAVEAHLERTGRTPKMVVWAHNSHLGDARFTDMRTRGEWNLGQLARERHGDDVFIVGFSTNTGTVTAAHDWDEPGRQMRVRYALPDSHERVLSEVADGFDAPHFLLLTNDEAVAAALGERRLQRAIGVIYRPETERISHYYEVDLSRQFDAVIHIDETSALRGLEPGAEWERGVEEPPETFPTGI